MMNGKLREISFYAIKSEDSVCEGLTVHLPVPTVHQNISFVLTVCCQSNCKRWKIKWRSHYETHLVLFCRFMPTEHRASGHSSHVRNRGDAFSYRDEKTDTRMKLNIIKKQLILLFGADTWLRLPYRRGAQIEGFYWLDIHGLQWMIPAPWPFFWCHRGGKNANMCARNIQICFKLNSLFTLML